MAQAPELFVRLGTDGPTVQLALVTSPASEAGYQWPVEVGPRC